MTNLELFTSIFGTERAMSVSWWAEEVSDKTIKNLCNYINDTLTTDDYDEVKIADKKKKGKK